MEDGTAHFCLHSMVEMGTCQESSNTGTKGIWGQADVTKHNTVHIRMLEFIAKFNLNKFLITGLYLI